MNKLHATGVAVEVNGFTVVKHVVFFVQIVSGKLRQFFLDREDQVVLGEASSALLDDTFGFINCFCLVLVPLLHVFLVETCMGHFELRANIASGLGTI